MFEKKFQFLFWTLAFCAAVFTQTTHLLDLPGLHFDEAWQGLFAHKIAVISDFYPTTAMNSYTSPILHYVLAIVFKIFSPSLFTMRMFFAVLNLSTLALLTTFIYKVSNPIASAIFCIFWALLPLSYVNHRFYIELTSFHGFCLAILIWALYYFKKPWSPFMIVFSILAGCYSHIIFITVYFSTLLISMRHFPLEVKSKKFQITVGSIALLLLPLTIRMAIDTKKLGPKALVVALMFMSLHFFGTKFTSKPLQIFSKIWNKYFFILSLPAFAIFSYFHFDGRWPLTQIHSSLPKEWLPINAAFLFLSLLFSFKIRQPNFYATISKRTFLTILILVSILVLKQSPRFMTIPMIFCFLWLSIEISQYRLKTFQLVWMLLFVSWNLYSFFEVYQKPFLTRGTIDREVKIWPFKENARDFRPFQKVYRWMSENGCAFQIEWVEDDRFKRAIEFLRLTDRPKSKKCEFSSKDEAFFSHIPEYSFFEKQNLAQLPPPTPQVKLFYHQDDWGDLAIFKRKK